MTEYQVLPRRRLYQLLTWVYILGFASGIGVGLLLVELLP